MVIRLSFSGFIESANRIYVIIEFDSYIFYPIIKFLIIILRN